MGHPTSCRQCASGALASRAASEILVCGRTTTLNAVELTSASLCLLREGALRNAAFGCQRADCPASFLVDLFLQLYIHKLPKLIALCFLTVRVLIVGVEDVCFVGTLTFASFCNVLHVIKTSGSAVGCCRSCGEALPFRLGLHQSLVVLCLLVLKRLLEHLEWFSHLRLPVAIVLAAVADASWI